ncbi:MAG: hypothetical protein Q8O99_01725 [bacterium]|nr:hypothetical protein [bacterium]
MSLSQSKQAFLIQVFGGLQATHSVYQKIYEHLVNTGHISPDRIDKVYALVIQTHHQFHSEVVTQKYQQILQQLQASEQIQKTKDEADAEAILSTSL